MPSPFATWNPERDIWEINQGDLFSGRLGAFSGTWPRSGMTLNGCAFERPMSELAIDASESSLPHTPRDSGGAASEDMTLLPTPMAQQSGNSPQDHLAKKPGRTRVTDLGIMVANDLLRSGGRLPAQKPR